MTTKTMLILGLIAGFSGSDLIIDQAYAQQPETPTSIIDEIDSLDQRLSQLEQIVDVHINTFFADFVNLFQAELISLNARVDFLEDTLNPAGGGGIFQEVSDNADNIATLFGEVDIINEVLYGQGGGDGLINDVEANANTLATHDSELSNHNNDIQQLQDDVQGLLGQSDSFVFDTYVKYVSANISPESSLSQVTLCDDPAHKIISGGYGVSGDVDVYINRPYEDPNGNGEGWQVLAVNNNNIQRPLYVNIVCLR